MTVTMKDNAEVLAEVVVTGYQVQRKQDLTGAWYEYGECLRPALRHRRCGHQREPELTENHPH